MKKYVMQVVAVVLVMSFLPIINQMSATENKNEELMNEVTVKTVGTDDLGYEYELNNDNMTAVLIGKAASEPATITGSFDSVIVAGASYDLVEIKADYIFNSITIQDATFNNLTKITGRKAFMSANLINVEMMSLKGEGSTGTDVFSYSKIDDKTNIAIDNITSVGWFNNSTIKGTTFPELTTISGGLAFSNLGYGSTDINFPKLKSISKAYNSFSRSSLLNFNFPLLEEISADSVFLSSTLKNVSIPSLKGEFTSGSDILKDSTIDDKTLIGIDNITSNNFLGKATIIGTEFPNLKQISGYEAFISLKKGTKDMSFPELKEISGDRVFIFSPQINTKFPKLEELSGNNAFSGPGAVITNVEFPVLETITGTNNFSLSVISSGELKFPNLKTIGTHNFFTITSLDTLSLGSSVPVTALENFGDGKEERKLLTTNKEDQKKYILDNQDGVSGDNFWFGFRTSKGVVFDSNGGSENVVELLDEVTGKVKKPVDATKENNTFLGWYYEDGREFTFDELGTSTDSMSEMLTVYAKWSKNYYTLTYDKNTGDGDMLPVRVDQGDEIEVLNSIFTKTGYSFNNWNTILEGGGESFSEGDMLNPQTIAREFQKNITLFAQWKPNIYTVEFNPNSAQGIMDPQEFVYDKSQDLNANTFNKTGYTFTNWNTKPDGSGDKYDEAQSIDNLATSGTVQLYAQWTEALDTKYTVNHLKENIDNDNYTLFETDELTGTTNADVTAIKNSYVGFTPETQEITGVIAPDGSLVLEVKYNRNKFDISFDANGALTTPDTLVDVKYESNIVEPLDVSKQGYTLKGWYTESSLDHQWNFGTSTVKEDMTLFAKWEKNNYIVEFDANSGVGIMITQDFKYDEEQKLNTNSFTKKNYTFTGWNTEKDGTGNYYVNEQNIINMLTSGTQVLYAQWELTSIELEPSTDIIAPIKPEVQEELENTGVMSNILIYIVILMMSSAVLLIKRNR